MLLSKTVILKWNPRIKKYYVNLGYTYTSINDEFEVNVEDLTDGSNAMVDVECDYCGMRYIKRWTNYLSENSHS